MTIVAITGDGATTLTLALAASWRSWHNGDRGVDASANGATDRAAPGSPLVVEADPAGGSLAGWLDTPAQPSVATAAAALARGTALAEVVATTTQRTASGLRVITAPIRRAPAGRAIAEFADRAAPGLAGLDQAVLIDLGRVRIDAGVSPLLRAATVIVAAHRQRAASAGAESVRLERFTEAVEFLVRVGPPVVVAVTGGDPFDPAEITRFVADAVDGGIAGSWTLPHDPLAAAVLCGRTGVSARRFARLPLMRAAGAFADELGERRRRTDRLAPASTSPTVGAVTGASP